ncbi:MAG: hypothetical protein ACRYHQ_15335, partial [Janthinobacterium lividum]
GWPHAGAGARRRRHRVPAPPTARGGGVIGPDIKIRSSEAIQAVADRLAQIGAAQAPLYAAAAAGRIALVCISAPATPWPAETVGGLTRPTVVLLGGDPGFGEPAFGPGRWRCARKARGWAAAAIVHGAGGEPDHYRGALAMAELVGRLALVETTSSLVDAWGAFLAPLPRIGYRPPNGSVHPVQPAVLH